MGYELDDLPARYRAKVRAAGLPAPADEHFSAAPQTDLAGDTYVAEEPLE